MQVTQHQPQPTLCSQFLLILINQTCFNALKSTMLIFELDFVISNLNIHRIVIKRLKFLAMADLQIITFKVSLQK